MRWMRQLTPLEALRELESMSLVTARDGAPCPAIVRPGLSALEIEQIERSLGVPVPPEARELMETSRGLIVGTEELDWTGVIEGQFVEEAMPLSIALLSDDCGNSWNVDIDPKTGAWGAVYYCCHDAPVIVFQAESLAVFIEQFGDQASRATRDGLLRMVAEQAANRVWSTGGSARVARDLTSSADRIIAHGARIAGDGLLCDLRDAGYGDGFAWGQFGPRTKIIRPGPEPVWIIKRPDQQRRWWKLWG